MVQRGTWMVLGAIGIAILGLIPQASAQWLAGGPGATTAPGGAMINMNDPNTMKAMQDQLKAMQEQRRAGQAKQLQDSLGASDEEWKALAPKIEAVQEHAREVNSGQSMLMGVGFGMRAMGRVMDGDPNRVKSEVEKTAEELKSLLDDTNARPDDIKKAMAAYRDARAKAKADLDKARQELKELLTVRQEAVLLARGMLE